MTKNMEVGFDSNFLTLEGKNLRANVLPSRSDDKLTVSPIELHDILLEGRGRILSEMESIYTERSNPAASRPSIFTTQLGTEAQSEGSNNKVFTKLGYKNGGVITNADEIRQRFHGHFAMIGETGFIPEVRRMSGSESDAGSWLSLRKPTLWEVADHWLGFDMSTGLTDKHPALERNPSEMRAEELNRSFITTYRRLGETAVDTMSDREGNGWRSHYQIGLLLSCAALKHIMGDADGFRQEIDDAFLYADNDPAIPGSAVRAIENSVFGI